MKKILAMICAALSLIPCTVQAGVIFSDNFDSQIAVLDANPTSWTVAGSGSSPSIDVINSGSYGLTCQGGGGNCVDLDGSTSNAGILSTALDLAGGSTYTALFDLSGNQRSTTSDTVDISFGTTSLSLTLESADPWETYQIVFTPTASGKYDLSFHNSGGDNVGAMLDNVIVQAVPEPVTLSLFGLGLFGLAASRRRKMIV